MPRPFRLRPPSLPVGAVSRPRLADLMSERWQRRVVSVVAGPGFGKTVLLTAAMHETVPEGGRQIWLTCEPADESEAHLLGGLARSLQLAPDIGLEAILDAVWAAAPSEICFVLDDVHEIPAGSPGAGVLGRLTRDLSANAHLVFASRDAIPVPLARLEVSGDLVCITEADLLYDGDELATAGAAHGIEPADLAHTGGWPALVALSARTGGHTAAAYVWEEVLSRLDADHRRLAALLEAAGGGDDQVMSVLAGSAIAVDEVVGALPLVERSESGWAVLHPLWSPVLRALLHEDERAAAQRAAGELHLRQGRFDTAVDLFVAAGAWEGVLEVIRAAEARSAISAPGHLSRDAWETPSNFGRWRSALPPDLRRDPEAQLAAALEAQTRAPATAADQFRAAATAFRQRADAEGEIAAISHEGLVRWWLNDLGGLARLHDRLGELAAEGSERARSLRAVGSALYAHMHGDSATVLSVLADPEALDRHWLPAVRWLRSVAFRRDGDLPRARDELARPLGEPHDGTFDPQDEIARSRIDWLEGRVDGVVERLDAHRRSYDRAGDRYLAQETGFEAAAHAAWIGDIAVARELIDAGSRLGVVAGALSRVLECIARAAVAVGEGDEVAAAAALEPQVASGDAAPGGPLAWYWADRAAIALPYVLAPATRPIFDEAELPEAHDAGRVLAAALVAARAGNQAPVRALRWPAVGVVRAHLPVRWMVELVTASVMAGNPAPDDLLDRAGEPARVALREVVGSTRSTRHAHELARLARRYPVPPGHWVSIATIGPLEVRLDGEPSTDARLRRARVRELLCYLVVARRARREAMAAELWPDAADPAHNLRVTLSYLLRVLEPGRPRGAAPFFVEADSTWIALIDNDRLQIDAWQLEDHLERARAAEREGRIDKAIEHLTAVLPLWRGEPYADAPYADWAEPHRARLRTRYVDAAVRVGELRLAARGAGDAVRAAEHALAADAASEPAYRLLLRAHLACGDPSRAREALRACRMALAELGVDPHPATTSLLSELSRHPRT